MKLRPNLALIVVSAVCFLASCAAPYRGPTPEHQVSLVSVGMTRNKVINLIGYPTKITRTHNKTKTFESWYYTGDTIYNNTLVANGGRPTIASRNHLRYHNKAWGICNTANFSFTNGVVTQVSNSIMYP